MASGNAPSRYETLEVIGSGGMATVWKARDRELGRFVALKRPHPSPDDSVVAARFRREAQSAAAVSHPNLVTVYDVGVDESGPFLVMELLDAPSLAETTVPLPEVQRVGRELASALAALHAAGIVHRDIKPANIMLADGGAQLTDFGIARSLRDAETLTQAGTTFATPAYAAPEVVSGGEYTEASDVYALATVLRELVAGRRVIPNDATQVMVTDPSWRSLLDPCLSSDPAARPSAAGFLATLQRVDTAATVPIATHPTQATAAGVQATNAQRRAVPVPPANRPDMAMPGAGRPNRSPIAIFVFVLVVLGVFALAFAATRDDGSFVDDAVVSDTLPGTVTDSAGIDTAPVTSPPATEAPATEAATVPTPEPSSAPSEPPPTDSPTTDLPTDDMAAARADLETFIGEIRGGTISDKEADKLVDDLAKAIDAAQDNDERNVEKRLESVSDRIQDKIDDDAARERAAELFAVILERLGVELDD